ncbi:MAG: DNA translocase FtsK [Patescibacteria group bacterium]|nr:DNA translocase FtsK [Patescibacteria group bacterium]
MARRRKRSRKGSAKAGSLRIQLKKSTVFSVLAVILLLLAGITIFSFLREGLVLIKLNDLFWLLFGSVSFLLPFIFILASIIFTKLKIPLREPNVLAGTLIFFASLLGLSQSGLVGNWIWEQVAVLITGAGALLIFLGGTLIGLVVLLNTSLEQMAKFFLQIFSLIKKYTVGIQKKKEKREPFVIGGRKGEDVPEEVTITVPVVKEGGNRGQLQPSIGGTVPSAPSSKKSVWQYPPLDILRDDLGSEADRGDVRSNAEIIEKTLESFGITARVKEVNQGPAVTQYALEVALGTKLSKITSLSNDMALALAAPTGQIRIEAPIPGRSLVGIEVPNKSPAIVSLKEMLLSKAMKKSSSKITVPLGLDVSGEPIVADIGKMPHVLIAGQTGSGKSVLLNSWISTILFKTSPDEVKLFLVDPKRVELTRYNGIPHLLTPVVVEPEEVLSALKWSMKEMDRRYRLFAEKGARNLEVYNNSIPKEEKLPFILIIIDELADIMLFAPADVEDAVCRIAQMARATGIHLVLTTQRPSVDVLTGLIKANIPCRVSCAVSSMTDSRVILDTPGAEKLLGRGDMLYTPPDQAKPTRIQGAFVTDEEVSQLINFIKGQGEAEYQEEVLSQPVSVSGNSILVDGEERDELFQRAADLIRLAGKASASLLQRKLRIGYARAARVIDQLEAAGIVGPGEGSKPREVIG